ncbi:hypothetical protein AKO1_011998 [Acrasis kona]|uniref:SAM domain-containing protein n=1 Tax=Acrasis kona TaxID=1008807 RepID=A0AAW2Z999_9EUKA
MGNLNSVGEQEPLDDNVRNWSTNDVSRWLVDNGFSDSKKTFLNQGVDGEMLITLTENKLRILGLNPKSSAAMLDLIRQLKELAETPPTSDVQCTPEYIPSPQKEQDTQKLIALCVKKLEKIKGFKSATLQEKQSRAKNLVIKNNLLETYLNANFVATRQTMETLLETTENTNSGSNILIKSNSNSIDISIPEEEQESYDDEDKNDIIRLVRETAISDSIASSNPLSMIKKEEFLKIKLVIVELDGSARHRTFRKILSPIMDTFLTNTTGLQYGLFHSALIVGPWYLEWNDSCLIVPRKCYSGAAVIAADVNKYFKGPQVSEAIDKISDVICDWNANYSYSRQTNNCQRFVDDICKALNIDINFDGALKSYLDQLRTKGVCDMSYPLTESMKHTLGIEDQEDKKFNTHKELDDFVKLINRKDPCYFDMDPAGQDDLILLKSYDRAFWLRHFKDKDQEKFTPHQCPFGDPQMTGSIVEANCFTYNKKV